MARKKKEEETIKRPLNKENLRKLLGIFQFMLPYKGKFIIGLICLFVSSFLVLSFPVLSGKLLDVASGKAWIISSNELISNLQNPEISKGIVIRDVTQVAMLLMGILVIQSIFSFIRVYFFAIVSENSIADLRKTAFSKMLHLPMKYFDAKRVGDLISRLTSDIAILQETFSITTAELFRQTTVLLVGIVIIAVMVPKLTLFMLAVFPALVLLALFFGRAIRRFSKESQAQLGNTNVIVEETLQSVLVVKAFTNEAFEVKRYGHSMDKTVQVALKAAKYRGGFISFIVFALFGAIVAVMWKGGSLINEGAITSGDLVTFVLVTMFIGASIAGLGDMFGQLQRAIGASERVLEVLNEDSEKNNGDTLHRESAIEGKISFEKVSFKYPDTNVNVLQDVSFEINPGEKVALVGPSGAGKSTIIQLIMRFYEIEEGNIKVDGKEISGYPLKAFRNNIGIVPQEVMLFGGTIRENILYGNPEATEEEVVLAAQKANATEFIERLEKGYETIVGDRGVKLSGGQRQRIAIARAILKNPGILVLDEATSSLDAESEILVQKALETLMEGRTTIIIAHRLSTIKSVDNILVIRDGKIKEKGKHVELSQKTDGLYSHLLKLQILDN
ncbi:MAG: ABC transporter transmembrane domain-containing protein [Cyclobacteriaceae bacterium]|nr:ABC transporter transmembrane domain-containing protein [Cyclobacteriaceae bacterium]